MTKYILKRIAQAIIMIVFISIISFLLMHMAPGDPATSYISPKMNAQEIEMVRERLGLNAPVHIQYIKWLQNVLKGDLGYSLINFRPVKDIIAARIPATIGLMGSSLLISLLFALPLGMYTARKKGSIIDTIITTISYIGISIPSFWLGIILIYIFAFKLHLLPSVGMRTIGIEDSTIDLIKHAILPCTVLSFYNIAVYTRYIRSNTIIELSQNYVKTEEAYGFSKYKIMFGYVLKNICLPIITILGMSLPSLVTGAFVTETVFGWPGMGRLGVDSIFNYDYPVIMATTMLTAILLIVGNFLADILYGVVDPRIRSER